MSKESYNMAFAAGDKDVGDAGSESATQTRMRRYRRAWDGLLQK